MKQPASPRKEETLWQGGPSRFTALRKSLTERYVVTNQRLKIDYGLLNRQSEEIELFRVQDLSVERSLFDRMFGVGNIIIHSGDSTGASTVLYDIQDVESVKDLIREQSRIERQRHRVGVFEENWQDGSME